jgi:putative endonuclease
MRRRLFAGLLRGTTTGKGRSGEQAALDELERRGRFLVERNHRNLGGEIDLIVRDRETLCFVEVKYRAAADFGGAIAAVDERKRRRLCRAATLYVAESGWPGPCRFDIVTVEREAERGFTVVLYEDAFQCDRA